MLSIKQYIPDLSLPIVLTENIPHVPTKYYWLAAIPATILLAKYLDAPKRYAAQLLIVFEKQYTELNKELKEKHLEALKDIKSSDPKAAQDGMFKLLEIGTGPGANFRYFPSNALVTASDPNPYFETQFKKYQEEFPDVKIERSIVAKAENLEAVESNSMDVVVSTLVLCGVEDTQQSLQEIKRVLAPGGKFLFWEHCGDVSGSWLSRVQKFSDATFWPLIVDGCHVSRDHVAEMKAAGFSDVESERFYIPTGWNPIMMMIKSHVRGVATK